jgi:hypothetical protein
MTENGRNAFVPMLITSITLVLWFGFQTYQLLQEKNNLGILAANQEAVHKNSEKMRAQLEVLASGTSKLAQQGNANAQQIVSALAQRGVTINSNEVAKPPAK